MRRPSPTRRDRPPRSRTCELMRRKILLPLIFIMALAYGGLALTLLAGNSPELGLDLQGGVSVVLAPTSDASGEQLDQALNIIRARVDALGVAEPEITRQGDAIVVQLPGVKNRDRALELVGQTAELRFRPVLQDLTGQQAHPRQHRHHRHHGPHRHDGAGRPHGHHRPRHHRHVRGGAGPGGGRERGRAGPGADHHHDGHHGARDPAVHRGPHRRAPGRGRRPRTASRSPRGRRTTPTRWSSCRAWTTPGRTSWARPWPRAAS